MNVATSNGSGHELTRKTLYDLDLVTKKVAQYSPHQMTYATANFEVATCHGLEEDAFTRKYII